MLSAEEEDDGCNYLGITETESQLRGLLKAEGLFLFLFIHLFLSNFDDVLF